jgi:hypothetical protein
MFANNALLKFNVKYVCLYHKYMRIWLFSWLYHTVLVVLFANGNI